MWLSEKTRMIQQLQYITKEFIAQFLPENPIIVEAGAHKGRDTLEMAHFWPQGHVYAFEPVPVLFKQLQEKTHNSPNISCYNLALSIQAGTSPFFMSNEKCDAVSSLLQPIGFKPSIQFSEIQVATSTLDQWAQENTISHIDLVWFDMQGGELAVLKASPHMLKNISVIHTEANLVERYKDQPLYPELKTFLESQGFSVVSESFYRGTWGNVLFVSKGNRFHHS